MTNYQHAKIYKITTGQTENIYIGSTTQKLNNRLSDHISNYNKYLNGNKRYYITSFEIIKHNDYKIELIEIYPCDNKNKLHEREQYYLDYYKDIIINKQKAYTGLTKIEYQKEYQKQRYKLNKEKIQEYYKQYHEINKEKIQEYNKQYNKINKEKILEQKKQYYEMNKAKILEKQKEKITCECGAVVCKYNLTRHKKSKKHINFINNN